MDQVAKNDKYIANKDEVTNLIYIVHSETGHGGERTTHQKLLDLYFNIPQILVPECIQHCERCVEKQKKSKTASSVVVKPLSAKDLNECGQVDIIDMQNMRDGSVNAKV